ncbi:MAG: VWA domain-containing protein [Leptolyngbya sp. PLA1]|nr:VWA domain-containing protein [Leptolyngbya sp. PLA1]
MAWAASVAGPVLLVLYLLRLRRRPVRVSTVRYWPLAAKDVQVNVPLKMLRPSWLLLLHVLIAGLAVCAVGRPAVSGVGGAGGRVVLLIDVSASMSAQTARPGISRLDDALDRARQLVRSDRASPSSQFAVVTFAAEPRVLCGFGGSHRASLDALSAVSRTDQPGDLRSALELADSLLKGAQEDAPRGSIILLSDEAAVPRDCPSHVKVESLPFHGEETPPNLGIVAFATSRSESSPETVEGLVEVVGTGPSPSPTVVSIDVDGEVVSRLPMIAAGNAGRTSVTFQLACRPGGVIRAALPGMDALASDDVAALVLAPVTNPRLMIVSPEGALGELPLGSVLLREVLSELRTSGLEEMSEREWLSRGAPTPPVPSMIIFDRVSPAEAPACPSLTFGADAPGRPGLLGSGAAGPPSAIFWDRRHPALRHVSLDGLSLDATPLVTAPEGWMPIARCSSAPIVLASETGRWPRLVVTFDLTRSNWPVQSGFPVFVASAVDLLTARWSLSRGEGHTTGEPIEIPAAPGASIAISGPASASAVAGPDAQVATAPPMALAGMYRAGDARLAVNLLNAAESSLTTTKAGDRVAAAESAPSPPADRREIWHWFAAGVLALLCVEWLVYARLVRT